jgi:hypothetical protein
MDGTGIQTAERAAALTRDKGTLRISFRLETDDLVAYALFTQWSAPERRGFRWFAMALPLLVGVVMTFSVPPAARVTTVHIVFLVLCGLGFFLTPRWVRYRISWRIRRQSREATRQAKGQTGEMLYDLGPAGFVVEGPKGRTRLPRGAYFFPRETDTHIFFFVQDKAAYVLPKAPFSPGELDEIRSAADSLARASKHS